VERARPGVVEVSPRTRGPGPILGDVEPKSAPGDLTAVHLLDGFRGLLFICKTNESKAAWAPGVAVGRDVNFHDFADLGEQLAELPIRHGEVEITYAYLV